jgi:1-deoxy-D-xylulose-5-phosphate reductoisomerase
MTTAAKQDPLPVRVSILGATGSIGQSAVKVARLFPDRVKIVGLGANENVDALIPLIREFNPSLVAVGSETARQKLYNSLQSGIPIETGEAGLEALAVHSGADIILMGVVGAVGLKPGLAALNAGKRLALANKEPMVMAGALFSAAAAAGGGEIIPVDSEHSALFQLIAGERRDNIRRLILTASGGPFRETPLSELKKVTRAQALKHPTWEMGPKITIDSATLMNKALEIIEAHFLFGFSADEIDAVIHPQSVVHSLLETQDGAYLAHLGKTDMQVPIQYAFSHPARWITDAHRVPLWELGKLEFLPPDEKKFPALALAKATLRAGGAAPAIFSAANEIAVEAFLADKLAYLEIVPLGAKVLDKLGAPAASTLEAVLEADAAARKEAAALI